jgi:Uncharacterized conserved protein
MERCRYLYVLWWADQAERNLLHVVPPGETQERGVFCTRSPARPNPLGLSSYKSSNGLPLPFLCNGWTPWMGLPCST